MVFVEIIIGGLIAAAVLYAVRRTREERFKKFFAGSLIIVALIYVGFAGVGISTETATSNWLIIELVGVLIYSFFAYAGVKISAWFLAVGWAAHVLWDVLLHWGESIVFVPDFYPSVCIGFDLVFAAYIAYRFYLRDSI